MSIKLNAQSGGSVALDAPTQTTGSADVQLVLPVAVGSANQFLKNSGTAGTLQYSTLKEDSNGYVTKPNNLCLQYTSSGSNDITSGAVIYATEVFDIGDSNAYNTSTGVFTAPVAGIYNIYHEYYNRSNTEAMTELKKSTDGGSSFSQIKIFGRQFNDQAFTSSGFSFLASLNANDQLKIERFAGTIHINNPYNHMHIQLVQ